MSSSGKKKTTMAKLTRESKVRERRMDKQARKDARKLAPADQSGRDDSGLIDLNSPFLAAVSDDQ
jgi:hypothetical protein